VAAERNHGTTPLYVAAENGNLAVVKVLLSQGANVNQGAGAIHDYLSNASEHIAYCSSTTPFHLRMQAETMAPLHSSWLPMKGQWRWWSYC
jgi:hypothetical protein